ncbi:unnamed protein product [Leuciscus chuanchicus]
MDGEPSTDKASVTGLKDVMFKTSWEQPFSEEKLTRVLDTKQNGSEHVSRVCSTTLMREVGCTQVVQEEHGQALAGTLSKSTVEMDDEPSTDKASVTGLKDVMPNKTGWEQPFSEEKIEKGTEKMLRLKAHVKSKLLPPEVLSHILLDVVYEEGDKAFHTLSLVCKKFNETVHHPGFLKKAHFAWLDSIVDWKSVNPDVRKEYRVEFKLTRCDACGFLYKNTTGYCGSGKKGVFTAFYSDKEFDGFCSMDCYYMAYPLFCIWLHSVKRTSRRQRASFSLVHVGWAPRLS